MKNRSELAGILLIVVGSIIALNNFNILYLPAGIISWKLLLILFLILDFVKGRMGGVVFWAIVASFAYFPLFFTSLNINSIFSLWPLLLIWIGVSKLTKTASY